MAPIASVLGEEVGGEEEGTVCDATRGGVEYRGGGDRVWSREARARPQGARSRLATANMRTHGMQQQGEGQGEMKLGS
jgi:hypothetical protein